MKLIIAGMMIVGNEVHAQDVFQVSGKITDTAGVALSHATVRLITKKDTLHTTTGENGVFELRHLTMRKFDLEITIRGYQSYGRAYEIREDKKVVSLPVIILKTDFDELAPVTVRHVKPIIINGDTVTYNTDAYPVRVNAEVEDVLKRLPGVEVDKDGNVTMQGKPVQKVLVNGHLFFGGDVQLALRNLPADIVTQLQLIDDYGDKARLTGVRIGEPSKVLNIVMKPDKRNGKFGEVSGGVSNSGKYTTGTFGNAFKGDRQVGIKAELSDNSPAGKNLFRSIGASYANKWGKHWNGNAIISNEGQDTHSSGSQIQDTYNPGQHLHQENVNQNETHSNAYDLLNSIEFSPDEHSMLHVNTMNTVHRTSGLSGGTFHTLEQDSGFSKSTAGSSLNKNESTTEDGNTNVYFQKTYPNSRRRFSAEAAFTYSGSRQNNDNQSDATVVTDTSSSRSLLHYLVDNQSGSLGGRIATTYFMPVGASSFLELGYRGMANQSKTDVLTKIPGVAGGPPVAIDSLSQDQVYRTFSQNIHAGYSAHFNRVDCSAMLDGQQGAMRGSVNTKGGTTSFHYLSLLPEIESSWTIDKIRKLGAEYTGQRNLPGLQQLEPFTNLTNPQDPVTGNPDLKPSFTHTGTLHYEQSNLQSAHFAGLHIGVGYAVTGNSIISNISYPHDSSQVVQRTTYLNAGTASTLSANCQVSIRGLFGKSSRINFSGDFVRSQTPTMTDGLLYTNQSWTWSQQVDFHVNVPDVIEVALEGHYAVTHADYPGQGNLPNTFKTASLSLNGQQYFFHDLIIKYQLSQPYNTDGNGLAAAPTDLNASLQYPAFFHDKVTVRIDGYNLLNGDAGTSQTGSASGITKTSTQFSGRYFLCTVAVKLSRFGK